MLELSLVTKMVYDHIHTTTIIWTTSTMIHRKQPILSILRLLTGYSPATQTLLEGMGRSIVSLTNAPGDGWMMDRSFTAAPHRLWASSNAMASGSCTSTLQQVSSSKMECFCLKTPAQTSKTTFKMVYKGL